MGFAHLISAFLLLSISSYPYLILAQQPYERKATTDCNKVDNYTSVLGYTCNGQNPCQAYLIFRSQPTHNSVSSISSLLSSDPSQLARINAVSENSTFETNKEVIVPVNCSCSGATYQANTSYVIPQAFGYYSLANITFQGLSTCQALQRQNIYPSTNIPTGTRINVPLRCACPTKNQSDDAGVKYLLTYVVAVGDYVSSISSRYGVDTGRVLEANGLSYQDFTIIDFTTLLIPLQNPPSPLQTVRPPTPPLPPPPPPPPPPTTSDKSSNKTWVYIIAGVIGGMAFILATGTIVYCRLFRKSKKETEVTESSEAVDKLTKKINEEPQAFLESLSSIAQSLKVYTFGELQAATDDFSEACLIKGSVFRGKINGDWAAIKKLSGDVSKEINLLNKINHFNLIRLSGVCFHDGHWFLVYEYAVNGSLSTWLHAKNKGNRLLRWTQRIQIALDVAAGLNYLHSYTSPPHVHKDVNSANVLLDGDFRAKITNFGLARSTEGQEGQFALTRHIVGTKGYMAPEYLEHGLVSPKLDVYAFGILMLELITGKEAAVLSGEIKGLIAELDEEDGSQRLRDLMDLSLQGNYPAELAIIMVRLIDRCLKKDPAGRPDINEIAQSLSGIFTASMNY